MALPTSFQLALALTLNKSKPQGSTIKGRYVEYLRGKTNSLTKTSGSTGYIFDLRKCTQIDTIRSGDHLLLDPTAFWRSKYEEATRKLEAVENKCSELTRQFSDTNNTEHSSAKKGHETAVSRPKKKRKTQEVQRFDESWADLVELGKKESDGLDERGEDMAMFENRPH